MSREIIEAIQKITGTQLKDDATILVGTVDSVDASKRSCVITSVSSKGRVTIEDVQLMADIDDGFLLVPKIDSTVIVCYSTYNKPFVALFSELERVLLVVGDSTLEVTGSEIKFNGGLLGGLVKVSDLVSRLNDIENKVNAIITWGATVTPPLATGPLTPTTRANIENEKIKQ